MTTRSLWASDLCTVEVDRSNPPAYPSWMRRVLYPERGRRPDRYDLRKDVEIWQHKGQKTWSAGGEVGRVIQEGLVRRGEIECQGRTEDLIAIKTIVGVELYRQLFEEKSVFALGDVVEGVLRGGSVDQLCASYLCLEGERVILDWEVLNQVLGPDDVIIRFKM